MQVKKAIRLLLRRFTSPWRSTAVVLLYHRVHAPETDPQRLCVSPGRFRDHMAALVRICRPVPLSTLVAAVQRGAVRQGTVAVTFDDGYWDNASAVLPILDALQVPATFFVSTALIGTPKEFWWDELERILLCPGVLPSTLLISLGEKVLDWRLGEDAVFSEGTLARHRAWHVECPSTPTRRHGLYRLLLGHLSGEPPAERDALLAQLRGWAGLGPEGREDCRSLTKAELTSLAESPMVTIGAHAMTHTRLSALTLEEQRREIMESKRDLEAVLGRRILHFSYPYGRHTDFDEGTRALVQEAGFEAAVGNFREAVDSKSDLFALPRFVVRDWEAEELTKRLGRWFRA